MFARWKAPIFSPTHLGSKYEAFVGYVKLLKELPRSWDQHSCQISSHTTLSFSSGWCKSVVSVSVLSIPTYPILFSVASLIAVHTVLQQSSRATSSNCGQNYWCRWLLEVCTEAWWILGGGEINLSLAFIFRQPVGAELFNSRSKPNLLAYLKSLTMSKICASKASKS